MKYLLNYGSVSTIVRMRHLYSNETLREKARWGLYKNSTCWFQQIPEATPNKTAAVRPLSSHLTNYLNQTNETCWALLEK